MKYLPLTQMFRLILAAFLLVIVSSAPLFADEKTDKGADGETKTEKAATVTEESKPTDDESKERSSVPENPLWVNAVTSLGESKVAVGLANGLLLRPANVGVVNLAGQMEVESLYEHKTSVWGIASSNDKKKIASVDYQGNLGIYDFDSGKSSMHEKAFKRWCRNLTFNLDSTQIVAGNDSGEVLSWSISDGKIIQTRNVEKVSIGDIYITKGTDGNELLFAAASDGSLTVWSGSSEKPMATLKVSESPLLAITSVENDLYLGGEDSMVYKISLEDLSAESKAEEVVKVDDWITSITSDGSALWVGQISGVVSKLTLGKTDELNIDSGIWALANGNHGIIAGTRKHGLVKVE